MTYLAGVALHPEREKEKREREREIETWCSSSSTHGGDHASKYLESHKLAGFRVYIMGYQVNLYQKSHNI